MSHFYISYSNMNEISYFKDIANCVPKKRLLNLQPEDGFIKKPKHVADLITFNYFYIIKLFRLNTSIYFINFLATTLQHCNCRYLNYSQRDCTSQPHEGMFCLKASATELMKKVLTLVCHPKYNCRIHKNSRSSYPELGKHILEPPTPYL